MIVTLDPGKHAHGVALWEDTELVCAWYQTGPDWEDAFRSRSVNPASIEVVVYEFPRIYSLSKSRGGLKGQNDLLDVAFAAGRAVERIGTDAGRALDEKRYEPRQWKGTTPKEIMTARIIERLSEEERTRVELPRAKGLAHNVFDGVGIGLYYYRRLHV